MTGTHLPVLTAGKGRALSASVLTTTEGGDCGVGGGETEVNRCASGARPPGLLAGLGP